MNAETEELKRARVESMVQTLLKSIKETDISESSYHAEFYKNE